MGIEITAIESTELFLGPAEQPRQVLRVSLRAPAGDRVVVRAAVPPSPSVVSRSAVPEEPAASAASSVSTVDQMVAGSGAEPVVVELGLSTTAPAGSRIPVEVTATSASAEATAAGQLVVAEPGWTMWMVSHFHYDPVWWNTQAGYTTTWDQPARDGAEPCTFNHPGLPGFTLVRAHLELARRDPDYKFVLAEVDYLKPYWDAHPEDRDSLRELIALGRVEIMGGTYNEPNTNLTSAETTIRNAVYGIGFQRDVLGADPQTAWQLDAFGHDPQFPGLMAEAGVTSSSWARGPFHQWGPMMTKFGDPPGPATAMQFASEFEWLSPSGKGLLTSYMPNHYSAGWWMDSAPTLAEAEQATYELFLGLKPVAATKNVLLPVGTDYTPPNKWITEIHRDWNARYCWPRFVCATPAEFFAATRTEFAARGVAPSPQTRDMNPVYTGKDVSYIDTKQAHRAAENILSGAEKFATVAALLGARYPDAALDKAWRQLIYGAHHDAITGSESDQVYLDLLTGWREAWELATTVRDNATAHLAALVDPAGSAEPGSADGLPVVVFNPLSWSRTDLVRVSVPGAEGLVAVDANGAPTSTLLDSDGSLCFLASDVPSIGYRTYRLVPGEPVRWTDMDGTVISNGVHRITVDPARGGGIASWVDVRAGRELLDGVAVGNELVVYAEYSQHPEWAEGPWHLVPTGSKVCSGERPATSVRTELSRLGQRITVTGRVDEIDYTQTITLWHGSARVDCRTTLDGFAEQDKLVRLRVPASVPGGLPVHEVGNAVVGRGFGLIEVDAATAPWTLDNPAYNFFGVSSTARVDIHLPGGGPVGQRAVGVAEIVVATEAEAAPHARDLAIALVRRGVTATCSTAAHPRYGDLSIDSNLPDFRIAIGSPERNSFTAEVLDAAPAEYRAEYQSQLAAHGSARVFVPASQPLTEVWQPNADLRDVRALPVLLLSGPAEAAALAAELVGSPAILVEQDAAAGTEPFDDYTVALLNRGTPGCAVEPGGALNLSLLRSCTGWPSGIWIDPPRRTTPDGSGFQLQHWTHEVDYALVAGAGDWRDLGAVQHGHEFNQPLHPVLLDGAASASPTDPAGPARVAEVERTLPAELSFFHVEPARELVITTVKPTGNPLASGRVAGSDPHKALSIRLYEPHGELTAGQLGSFVPLHDPAAADLLEVRTSPLSTSDGVATVRFAGAEIGTVVAIPGPVGSASATAHRAAAGLELGPNHEPAQPVYSRYWLHNTGPAPLGYQPVSVYLHPELAHSTGAPVSLRVSLASDVTDDEVSGVVTLAVPAGWRAEPASRPYRLGAGGQQSFEVTVTPSGDAAPGDHYVAAQISDHNGQSYEDVCTVVLPGADKPAELGVQLLDDRLTLSPGERSALRLRLSNPTSSSIRGQAHAVSPWGTWELVRDWHQGFEVAAGGECELTVAVEAPATAPPVDSWLLVRLGWFGRLHYTPAIPLRVEAK